MSKEVFLGSRQQTFTIFKVEGCGCSASTKTMSGIMATHIILHARLINSSRWYKEQVVFEWQLTNYRDKGRLD